MVFAVYEYYICTVHLTFWDFMASHQDYFTLLGQGKQVDGTKEEVLHGEPPHYLQAQRVFFTSSPNVVRTGSGPANKKSVTNSLDMAAAYITFECSFIS